MNEAKNYQPFERFSLSEDEFKALIKLHDDLNESEPRIRSDDELPFWDWEAEKLSLVLEHFKDDLPLCSLIARMMELVQADVLRRRAENALKLVPKPRANTIGMFFAPPLVLKMQPETQTD